MSLSLQIFLIVSCLIFLCIVIIMLRRDKLNLKYTLVWLITSAVMLVFSIFPDVAASISKTIGIVSPVNTVFLFGLFFILLILFTFTIIITRISERVKNLTQYVALLEKELRKKDDD